MKWVNEYGEKMVRRYNLWFGFRPGTAVLDNAIKILPPEKKPKQPTLVLDERGWTLKE